MADEENLQPEAGGSDQDQPTGLNSHCRGST